MWGEKNKSKKILVIITSLPIIPGIPWLWWYGVPIHSYVNVCVCVCICLLAQTAAGHAHNTQTHRHTEAFPCKLKREGVTEEHGRPWEKKAATEPGVLVWNPATKEPRIKHTMGMGCGLRGGRECVWVCVWLWEREREGGMRKRYIQSDLTLSWVGFPALLLPRQKKRHHICWRMVTPLQLPEQQRSLPAPVTRYFFPMTSGSNCLVNAVWWSKCRVTYMTPVPKAQRGDCVTLTFNIYHWHCTNACSSCHLW